MPQAPISFPSTYNPVGFHLEWETSFQKRGFGTEVVVTPPQAAIKLAALNKHLKETQSIAEGAKEALREDMVTRFETETDPTGQHWEPLVKRAPTQQGILQLSGAMRDAAISEPAFVATPEGVFFDTSVLPYYWIYHDQPSKSASSALAQRRFYAAQRAKQGSGSRRLPQRKFIGVSAEAEERIFDFADIWLAERLGEL